MYLKKQYKSSMIHKNTNKNHKNTNKKNLMVFP